MSIKLRIILTFIISLIINPVIATTKLSNITVNDNVNKATVILKFNKKPEYSLISLNNPERLVIDVMTNNIVQKLPIIFSDKNIVKRIRTSKSIHKHSLRIVLELTCKSNVQTIIKQFKGYYNLFLILTSQKSVLDKLTVGVNSNKIVSKTYLSSKTVDNTSANQLVTFKNSTSKTTSTSKLTLMSYVSSTTDIDPIVVAIDAGHGGQDPGAIGYNGLYEKNVTIAIAHKLQTLLNLDPMFKPILTRDGDYFISVKGRSDIARKRGASVLISIHADAAPNRNASGTSVWVLSNQRANSEMANWLEQHEKQSELLGGVGYLLANSQADPYLSKAVLDLQFGHSQRVGHSIAMTVLGKLKLIGSLHKHQPEYASLGVLRSPDIPSLLVETGFISNIKEEKLLGSSLYQDKIANALYQSLSAYFLKYYQSQMQNDLQFKNNIKEIISPIVYHIVKQGETLSAIARQYEVSIASILILNKLKTDLIFIGQKLGIPVINNINIALSSKITPIRTSSTLRRHRIVYGDTLTGISTHYGVSVSDIKNINNITSNNIELGKTLLIPY